MNKILDLIFEDVKNENETKKTAVTLRISALIFIGYFLCLMAVFCGILRKYDHDSGDLRKIKMVFKICIRTLMPVFGTAGACGSRHKSPAAHHMPHRRFCHKIQTGTPRLPSGTPFHMFSFCP